MSEIDPRVEEYMTGVESGSVVACEDQRRLCKLVRAALADPDVYIDSDLLTSYLGLVQYLPFPKLFPWEIFCAALHLCTFRHSDGMPRWPELMLYIGRGAGKDGFISFEAECVTSPYSGLKDYDVDICANLEDQAMRPVTDLSDAFQALPERGKIRHFYSWTVQKIKSLKTGAVIRGRTNNPKGKDGMRSGMIVFNEIHQYEDYRNINVFMTGLGKKHHPRVLWATTDGDVCGGPLDDKLELSRSILSGDEPDNGFLPFLCHVDDKAEIDEPKCWAKANPSLPYLPDLMTEIEREYRQYKANPLAFTAFATKRMNLRSGIGGDIEAASWDSICATSLSQEQPRDGETCVCGVDFSRISDWCGVDFHFRRGDLRIDLCHAFVNQNSPSLPLVKAPWREWVERGLLDVVSGPEISPDLIAAYIARTAAKYNLVCTAVDSFRVSILSRALENVGISHDFGNLVLIRPSDIMRVVPVVDSCFVNHNFAWGDDPMLRWAANNTKKVAAGKAFGTDTGNFYYAKIEAHARKTDPFMALVAAMCIEDKLPAASPDIDLPGVVIY